MNSSFEKGFEKNAFIGGLARTFGSRLLTRGGQKMVSKAKDVGTKALKNPMSTAGKGLGLGLVGMEASSVVDKTKKSLGRIPGTKMTAPSFKSVRGNT